MVKDIPKCPKCGRSLVGIYTPITIREWECPLHAKDPEDPLHCEAGGKVRFTAPRYCRKDDTDKAGQYLVKGEVYTVKEVDIDAWHTDIFLEEVPGVPFNGDLFCRVLEREKDAPASAGKLDRGRWEGCPTCGRWQVYGYRNYQPAYCRDCGKPLNEPAWAELERRIYG